jgi:hypothetical protein
MNAMTSASRALGSSPRSLDSESVQGIREQAKGQFCINLIRCLRARSLQRFKTPDLNLLHWFAPRSPDFGPRPCDIFVR